LLSIDATRHEPGHKELIKSEAIVAFNEYFAVARDKKKITEFVKQQAQSKSPKARKIAKKFLETWAE
jgi:hypothetical protein